MTFAPIPLLLRLLGGGWTFVKGAANWARSPFERLLLIVAVVLLCGHWFLINPRLRAQIDTLETRIDAEVAAHQKTKDDTRKAMLRAEQLARAAVEVEMERQDANATIAIDNYRARTGDLELRAERLRQHFGGAALGRPSSGADLPATMAHSGGVAQAGADHRLSRAAGDAGSATDGATCPAQLMDAGIAMSIEERRVATEQAQQLDAILTLDALNAAPRNAPNAGAAPHE